MHTKKHVISGVKPDSIAMELELEPGDELISINGKEIEDVFGLSVPDRGRVSSGGSKKE